MPASAQNDLKNVFTGQETELAERQRIQAERVTTNQALEEQRKVCYQKLAVTTCLNAARDVHNEKMRDLKRQDVALNDVQRKRAAADRLRDLDERNSPQAQLEQSQRRGRALDAAAQREEERAERQRNRAAKHAATPTALAASAAPTVTPSKTPQAVNKSVTHSKPAPTPMPKLQAAQSGAVIRAETERQAAAEREKAADQRRAKVQEREANRKKPASAPLPVPP